VGLYLAAAGVGRIGLVDYDRVEVSNLQRQVIHDTSKVGQLKVESASQRMLALNPTIQVDVYNEVLNSQNAEHIAGTYSIIVDGTDNFPTRYLINDLCVLTGKPFVYGSVYRFEGQVSVFDARYGPCYRCLFPEPPSPNSVPTCAEGGVLGVLPGTIGMLQATEVLKLALSIGAPLYGVLLVYDALETSFQSIRLRKNPDCLVCSAAPRVTHLIDYEAFCGTRVVGAAHTADRAEIAPSELAARMQSGAAIQLVDVRQPVELQVSALPGAYLIPVDELTRRTAELDPSQETVVFCRSGHRSARAAEMLRKAGFANVKSLRGGINAWAREVDTTVRIY
jgi:adenylyltransferase/sulfurtransferase